MFKAQDIVRKHGHDSVEILIGGWQRNELECRALPLLRRFDFVRSARYLQIPPVTGSKGPLLLPGDPTDEKGRYRYIPDGKPPFYLRDEVDFVAIPNRDLENGVRLEDWLPEYEIDWGICKNILPSSPFIKAPTLAVSEYEIDSWKRVQVKPGAMIPYTTFTDMSPAWAVKSSPKITDSPYVVFFMGAECNNLETSRAGHNRGALWNNYKWVLLGDQLIDHYGVKIVVVGAGYDASYYEKHVQPKVSGHNTDSWINAIAEFSILETLEICSQAKAVVSYQSGIGIMSHYLNVPTAIWWRPEGDSIVEGGNLTFDERMASAWMYPGDTKSLPMIYGKHGVDSIIQWMEPHL